MELIAHLNLATLTACKSFCHVMHSSNRKGPGLAAWHFLCQIPEIWYFLKWFGMENFGKLVWQILDTFYEFGIFLNVA